MRSADILVGVTRMDDIYQSFAEELQRLKAHDQFRHLRDVASRNLTDIDIHGQHYVNLSSNDYLGLGADRRLLDEFFAAYPGGDPVTEFGMASSSSRLLTGNTRTYSDLEHDVMDLYQTEAACVFNSGYHANVGILSAVCATHDLVLSDKLNHASIIDGLKLSGARFMRYRHCDYDHLAQLLERYHADHRRIVIITESVFSMDGDVADLARLVELKQRYQALLIVDEAHAIGVFGQRGGGICEAQGMTAAIDIIVSPLGKAMASLGAVAAMRSVLKDYLINTMRPLIFTTALPPILLRWNRFIFQKMISMEPERQHVQNLAQRLRSELSACGLTTGGASQIVPVILGENQTAVAVAEALQQRGFLAFAIRPPTVPPNTARLRLSLSAAMTWPQIQDLPGIIGKIVHEITVDR